MHACVHAYLVLVVHTHSCTYASTCTCARKWAYSALAGMGNKYTYYESD